MKCNIRELAHLSDQPCVIEGRLNYKKISNASYRNQTGILFSLCIYSLDEKTNLWLLREGATCICDSPV